MLAGLHGECFAAERRESVFVVAGRWLRRRYSTPRPATRWPVPLPYYSNRMLSALTPSPHVPPSNESQNRVRAGPVPCQVLSGLQHSIGHIPTSATCTSVPNDR